ncbi:MAG: CHAT domain-containing protein [Anaerolinea sp.]|nr:CHAT domain-containing protein [Anaerolinea sp.]
MTKTILVLAANPKNTPLLRLDQEVREIDNGLERAQRRDDFILKQKWAARPVDVRRAMLDFKPNIVHFCGHGSGEEGIAFEDETGQAKLVNADTLAEFFELFADKLECVILNACYSEVQAEAVAEHIPYVIGMKKAIGDTAAIEFSVAFYDALGAGKSIEFAYKLACNAIQWSNMLEYLTPTLKSKKSAQPIVNQEKLFAYAKSLRIEIATNLHILDEPIAKMGFLSDIRYVEFVKSGNIAYLPFVIFDKVIRSYNRLHQLNSHVLKCRNHDPEYKSDVAQTHKYELAEMLQELIDIFDTKLQVILDSLDYDEEENESNYLLYALRFEAETNKIWLEDIYTTLNYLRTDAWDIFRKNQNEVDIPHPLMDRLNTIYQKLYVINDFHINNLRNQSTDYDEQDAIRDKEVLIDQINIFTSLFDKYFPRISANFRK